MQYLLGVHVYHRRSFRVCTIHSFSRFDAFTEPVELGMTMPLFALENRCQIRRGIRNYSQLSGSRSRTKHIAGREDFKLISLLYVTTAL